jgi:Xaa-Pro aminopeptidase
MLLDQLLRWREIEQAQREFGEITERIHKRVRESGEPDITDQEIQAEVDAVRAERAGHSR